MDERKYQPDQRRLGPRPAPLSEIAGVQGRARTGGFGRGSEPVPTFCRLCGKRPPSAFLVGDELEIPVCQPCGFTALDFTMRGIGVAR